MMTPEKQSALRSEAAQVFGDVPEHGLFAKLLEAWGPVLGPLLLKFIMSKVGAAQPTHANAVPEHALASSGALRQWVVAMLRAHKSELDAFIAGEVPALTEAGLAAMEA